MYKYRASVFDRKSGHLIEHFCAHSKSGLLEEIRNRHGFIPPENHRKLKIVFRRCSLVGMASWEMIPHFLSPGSVPKKQRVSRVIKDRDIMVWKIASIIDENNEEVIRVISFGNSDHDYHRKKAVKSLIEKTRKNPGLLERWNSTRIIGGEGKLRIAEI